VIRNRTILAFIIFALFTVAASASDQSTSAKFDATLEKDLHVKRVKVGDAVSARVKTAVQLTDGTKVPKGAKLLGHVTDVKQKADESGPSRMGLLFDKVVIGKDEEKPISVTLISLAPPTEVRGVNQLASQSGMSGAGRISSLSSSTGRGSSSESSENVLSSGVGSNSGNSPDPELRPGISGIDGVTIGYKASGPDTMLENRKESVFVQRWSRLLFQVN
jgi:hypothetical protein